PFLFISHTPHQSLGGSYSNHSSLPFSFISFSLTLRLFLTFLFRRHPFSVSHSIHLTISHGYPIIHLTRPVNSSLTLRLFLTFLFRRHPFSVSHSIHLTISHGYPIIHLTRPVNSSLDILRSFLF
ncbi:unnamed protein product, partial [Brassica rapa subsp. narinosa]